MLFWGDGYDLLLLLVGLYSIVIQQRKGFVYLLQKIKSTFLYIYFLKRRT